MMFLPGIRRSEPDLDKRGDSPIKRSALVFFSSLFGSFGSRWSDCRRLTGTGESDVLGLLGFTAWAAPSRGVDMATSSELLQDDVSW